jgi:putative DNA primase/helicase
MGGTAMSDSNRPLALTPKLDQIPADLKALRQWVNWRFESRSNGDSTTKWTKPPYQPNERHAKSSEPATWVSFDEASQALRSGRFDGIGFVFSKTDDFVGVDLDHVRDPDSGDISLEARAIIAELASYTEVSPSGTGIHVYCRGKLPGGGRKRNWLEVYDHGRFFTFTGHHLEGTPETVQDRSEALARFYERTFGPQAPQPAQNGAASLFREDRAAQESPHPENEKLQPHADDAEVLDCLRDALGEKFSDLYDRGNLEKYRGDQSRADLALLGMLAAAVGGDRARMERMFSASALGQRDKWRKRPDYRNRSIEKALEGVAELDTSEGNDDSAKPRRDATLAYLKRVLRLDIAHARKYGSVNAEYKLELKDGKEITFDNATELFSPSKARVCIGNATLTVIPIYSALKWAPILAKILSLVETVADDGGRDTETREWLADVFPLDPEARVDIDDSAKLAGALRGLSVNYEEIGFRGTNGRMYLRLSPLMRYINIHVAQRTARADITRRLSRLRFEPAQVSARDKQGVAKVRLWISPAGFDPSNDGTQGAGGEARD